MLTVCKSPFGSGDTCGSVPWSGFESGEKGVLLYQRISDIPNIEIGQEEGSLETHSPLFASWCLVSD